MRQTSVFLTLTEGNTPVVDGILAEDIDTSTSAILFLPRAKQLVLQNIHIRNISSNTLMFTLISVQDFKRLQFDFDFRRCEPSKRIRSEHHFVEYSD